ncbi:MAG TPA: cysteine hydrolase family protein [Candidatus Dormibacteraeota bacterium]|nr:cysteine hydrolase family protein [Candidatus Dormibacteraeota bacterium]
MASREIVFWDVDTQRDFMLPDGKLYVPGAEKRIPRLERLVNLARQGRVLLISSVDAHTPDDPEFLYWPPHCVQGTPGQRKISETLTDDLLLVPNDSEFHLPRNLRVYKQVILEKQTLDVFDNPNTEKVLKQLGPDAEYCVFGMVTELCVRLAVLGMLKRGCHVAVITDAIEALQEEEGRRSVAEFVAAGAQLLQAEEAVALVDALDRDSAN